MYFNYIRYFHDCTSSKAREPLSLFWLSECFPPVETWNMNIRICSALLMAESLERNRLSEIWIKPDQACLGHRDVDGLDSCFLISQPLKAFLTQRVINSLMSHTNGKDATGSVSSATMGDFHVVLVLLNLLNLLTTIQQSMHLLHHFCTSPEFWGSCSSVVELLPRNQKVFGLILAPALHHWATGIETLSPLLGWFQEKWKSYHEGSVCFIISGKTCRHFCMDWETDMKTWNIPFFVCESPHYINSSS